MRLSPEQRRAFMRHASRHGLSFGKVKDIYFETVVDLYMTSHDASIPYLHSTALQMLGTQCEAARCGAPPAEPEREH